MGACRRDDCETSSGRWEGGGGGGGGRRGESRGDSLEIQIPQRGQLRQGRRQRRGAFGGDVIAPAGGAARQGRGMAVCAQEQTAERRVREREEGWE
jgi:hypothetical protein